MRSRRLLPSVGLIALLVPALAVLPGCQDLPDNEKQTTVQILKPFEAENAEGFAFMLGLFTFTQTVTYRDVNGNDYWDANEAGEGGPVRMTFNHNSDWSGFIEFTASGNGWSYGNGIDLPTAQSGSLDFGIVGTQTEPISSESLDIAEDLILNRPSGGG